jgi:hypothetical protein
MISPCWLLPVFLLGMFVSYCIWAEKADTMEEMWDAYMEEATKADKLEVGKDVSNNKN